MPDLEPATNADLMVRALKGNRLSSPNLGDYYSGGAWHMYGPTANGAVGAPSEGDMDKDPSHPIYQSPSNWAFPPTQEHGLGNKIGQGLFGTPPGRLQQLAGDVVPFPDKRLGPVLEPDQFQRALEKMKGVDTRKLLDDVLGAPSNVTPFPSPPSPIG